jgi:hypothetical protein
MLNPLVRIAPDPATIDGTGLEPFAIAAGGSITELISNDDAGEDPLAIAGGAITLKPANGVGASVLAIATGGLSNSEGTGDAPLAEASAAGGDIAISITGVGAEALAVPALSTGNIKPPETNGTGAEALAIAAGG